MNNKIKIVATAAISTMMLAGCSVFEPSDGFVNVDPPVDSEISGEDATE